ncbi:MAG: hypothetical protein V3R93_05565 [Candidatus Hydrothermarchaeaceae archaeon]
MAGDDSTEKITELEIEKEAITATLEELKAALDREELTEEDYENSKKEYEDRLADIDKELEDFKAKKAAKEAEEKVKEEETVAEEPTAPDYGSMSWADLQKLASERGLQVVGKGVTKDKVIADLEAMDRGEVVPPPEEEKPRRRPAKEVGEVTAREEVPLKREIDPSITARLEMLKGEIPSLNSTLNSLTMKLQVSKSSLEMIKKNRDDGLVDDTTYNNLKTKYEAEIDSIANKIKEIGKEVAARQNVVKEYESLVKVYEGHSKKIKTSGDDILEKEMELNFMGSSKFYLVSNIKDHIAKTLTDIEGIEGTLSGLGISYPDEAYIEDRKEEIGRESDNLAEIKTKISNFETLLKSLEKELKEDELDKETFNLLKTEYTREKNRTIRRMGRAEGRVRMLKTEMKAYEKLDEALASCKSYIDMAADSFKKIWMEDKINSMNAEINEKVDMIKDEETELSDKLVKMEEDIEKLLAGFS